MHITTNAQNPINNQFHHRRHHHHQFVYHTGQTKVPIVDCITDLGIIYSNRLKFSSQYHQYADDTQLHLAMRADNTPPGLSVLTECTTNVRQWYTKNGLQLKPDKSQALIIGTTNQLRVVTSSVSSVSVAGVDLPAAEEIDKLESVQMFFTRKLSGLKKLSCFSRLKMLGLETLERRRLNYDLVLYYKILHGHCDTVLSFASGSIVSHVAIILNLLNKRVVLMSENFFMVIELLMHGIVYLTL